MKQVNRVLIEETRKNLAIICAVAVLTFLVVGFDVIYPWPFKLLIDNVLTTDPLSQGDLPSWFLGMFASKYQLGLFAVFVYFASTLLQAIAEYFKSLLAKTSARLVTENFSKLAFASLETIGIGFFSKQKIGDYIYRLNYDTSALGELVENGILPLSTSLVYLIITIGILFIINVKLTLISLASLPFLTAGMYYFNQRIESATKLSERYNSTTFAFIEQAMLHLKIIQAFSREQKGSEAFDRRIDTSLRNEFVVSRLDFLLSLVVGILIAISYSIVLLFGMNAIFEGTLTTGLLVVFIFYLDNLTNPIIEIIYALTATQQAYVKITRMEDFFSEKARIPYHLGSRVPSLSDDIRFDRVTVLAPNGKPILNDVSFTIEHGKRTIIFGINGSGKTTIVNLLMRFIEHPSSGRIYLGPHPLEEYDVTALRNSIAYVPQEVTLFNDSIKNNILFGQAGSERDVRKAAALADADSFVTRLPGGYDFRVGELGGYLSGGQKQRLMLARALMKKDATMYLFDEGFAALDLKTRHEVLGKVYRHTIGKTMILVSNIFDTLRGADAVIVLSEGKLLYSGSSSRLPKEISLERMLTTAEPKSAGYEQV